MAEEKKARPCEREACNQASSKKLGQRLAKKAPCCQNACTLRPWAPAKATCKLRLCCG